MNKPVHRLRAPLLDDYQDAARRFADWERLQPEVKLTVLRDRLEFGIGRLALGSDLAPEPKLVGEDRGENQDADAPDCIIHFKHHQWSLDKTRSGKSCCIAAVAARRISSL